MTIENKLDENGVNEIHKDRDAEQRVVWAYETFGAALGLTTSGGKNSAVLPHIVRNAFAKMQASSLPPLIFVDTGHYPESTYEMLKILEGWGFDLNRYHPQMPLEMEEPLYDDAHLLQGFEKFRQRVKHEPLNRAFSELGTQLWLRGIRYYQTDERSHASFFENKNGLYRLHPILDWSRQDVESYIAENNLPINTSHFDVTKDEKGECGIGE